MVATSCQLGNQHAGYASDQAGSRGFDHELLTRGEFICHHQQPTIGWDDLVKCHQIGGSGCATGRYVHFGCHGGCRGVYQIQCQIRIKAICHCVDGRFGGCSGPTSQANYLRSYSHHSMCKCERNSLSPLDCRWKVVQKIRGSLGSPYLLIHVLTTPCVRHPLPRGYPAHWRSPTSLPDRNP